MFPCIYEILYYVKSSLKETRGKATNVGERRGNREEKERKITTREQSNNSDILGWTFVKHCCV